MKKIIYGLLILVGGLVIASNFMVDTSKLDHKLASASGTACRWVSESGYGVGPHQINSAGEATCSDDGKRCDSGRTNVLGKYIDIIPCNSNNSSDQKNGNYIYTSENTPYTGYIRFVVRYQDSAVHPVFLYVNNGKIKNIREFSTTATSSYYSSNSHTDAAQPNLFSYYSINLEPILIEGTDTDWWGFNSTYDQYPINDGEWDFTCVCAEY